METSMAVETSNVTGIRWLCLHAKQSDFADILLKLTVF